MRQTAQVSNDDSAEESPKSKANSLREVEQIGAEACAAWLEDASVDEDNREDDHDDAYGPGYEVEGPGVGVLAHEVAPID